MRVVVFKDADAWIAQCLEHDICAQGDDLPALRANLEATIEADRAYSLKETGEQFGGIPAAPGHFFKMWDGCATRIEALESEKNVELALCA